MGNKKLLILDLNSALFHPGTQALEIGVESALTYYTKQGWIIVVTTYLMFGETKLGAISRYRNILKRLPAIRKIYCMAAPSGHLIASLTFSYQTKGDLDPVGGFVYPSNGFLCSVIADWTGSDYFAVPQKRVWDLLFVSDRAPLSSLGIDGFRCIDTNSWHEQIRTKFPCNFPS